MTEYVQSNKDRYFKGQYYDEECITFFRQHWITLLPELLMYGVFGMMLLISGFYFVNAVNFSMKEFFPQFFFLTLLALLTYFIHRFFFRLFNHFLHTVILTNFRIVDVTKVLFVIFIRDTQQTFDMKEIQDIQKQQDGFWKNVLRFGVLIIMMSSSDIKRIYYVPNPDYHFRLVNRIKRIYIQQRVQDKQQERPHESLEMPVKQEQSTPMSSKNFLLNDVVSLYGSDDDRFE